MAPSEVTDIPERLRTSAPFADQPPLAAVLFAASSIGLEALASGVPTVRFLPQGAAGLNPLPHGVSVIAADAPALGPTLRAATVSTIDISRYYAPADVPMWRSVLLQ